LQAIAAYLKTSVTTLPEKIICLIEQFLHTASAALRIKFYLLTVFSGKKLNSCITSQAAGQNALQSLML